MELRPELKSPRVPRLEGVGPTPSILGLFNSLRPCRISSGSVVVGTASMVAMSAISAPVTVVIAAATTAMRVYDDDRPAAAPMTMRVSSMMAMTSSTSIVMAIGVCVQAGSHASDDPLRLTPAVLRRDRDREPDQHRQGD